MSLAGTSPSPPRPDSFAYAADILDPPDQVERRRQAEAAREASRGEARTWRTLARPDQRPPSGDWRTWYVRGGRGGGKTWTGARTLAEWIRESDAPGQWGVVAPTYGDARDTCIEGESGLLDALGLPRQYRGWNRSIGELWLPDGNVVYADGADDGALRVQGKNLRGAWCDEVGLWKKWQTAWDESVEFAVRKGEARIVATGTPKWNMPAKALVRKLLDDPAVPKSRLRTLDNAAHLSERMLANARALVGTKLGQQELDGDLLDELSGMFRQSDFRHWRYADVAVGRVMLLGQCDTLGEFTPDPAGRYVRPETCWRFITVDLAKSLKTSADWTVISVWAVAPLGELLLVDRGRRRMTEDDHWPAIQALMTTHAVAYVAIESRMLTTTVVYEAGRANAPYKELVAAKDKVERALPAMRRVQQHRTFFPADAEWLGEWEAEHMKFPDDGEHDDQVDTHAYAALELATGGSDAAPAVAVETPGDADELMTMGF